MTTFQITALPAELREAIEDSRQRRNLTGPFDSAEAAVASMLESHVCKSVHASAAATGTHADLFGE